MALKVAVEKARKIRERAKAGRHLMTSARGEATIATAWPLYQARLIDENASPKTLAAYEHCYDAAQRSHLSSSDGATCSPTALSWPTSTSVFASASPIISGAG